MPGPTFPVDVPMTSEQAGRLVKEGQDEIVRRGRTPEGSAHRTHAGGQTYWHDRNQSVGGQVMEDELRFQD